MAPKQDIELNTEYGRNQLKNTKIDNPYDFFNQILGYQTSPFVPHGP
jgi:hypothetical protein